MNQEQGVPTGSLLGAFFAVVVLCAVFFSLGFFLGYRQARPANALATEQVPAASDVPSTVNAPEPVQPSAGSEPDTSGTTSPADSTPADSEPERSVGQPRTGAPPPSVGAAKTASAAEDQVQSLDPIIAPRLPAGLLVQVAAVTNRQDAANVVSVLKSRNYPAMILTPAQAKAKDSFYRVVAGPYKSRTDAERVRNELTAEGFKPFIR